jgi:hypothetical protein
MRELDAFLTEYEFSERHRIAIRAPAERIDAAIRAVRLDDSRLVRALFRVRGLRRLPTTAIGSIPGASVLDDAPGEGIVLGLRGDFWRLRGGGDSCEAVIDFRAGDGALTTETRVHVADRAARRKFAFYWRVVRPFSGLIRILWLRAAKRRAEA